MFLNFHIILDKFYSMKTSKSKLMQRIVERVEVDQGGYENSVIESNGGDYYANNKRAALFGSERYFR